MPDRRHTILDAAIAVIARRGVRSLRVEEVAAEANEPRPQPVALP